MTPTIESAWHQLRSSSGQAQKRIDASHPLDLYADFLPPDRPGLLLICRDRPPEPPALSAINVERRERSDGRWILRVMLEEPSLVGVFAELCRDIIDSTRTGVPRGSEAVYFLSRLERWQTLLQPRRAGLDRTAQMGLIGELLAFEELVLPELGPEGAVASWTGPLRAPQDFLLPSGRHLEVKAIGTDADRIRINGLAQLDAGSDPLQLVVVRLEMTGQSAPAAIDLPALVARLRERLSVAPQAARSFDGLLAFAGWDATQDRDWISVRRSGIVRLDVDSVFPRLTASTVPPGVVEATYWIAVPGGLASS